jgi:large subunit ribosomal protein L6
MSNTTSTAAAPKLAADGQPLRLSRTGKRPVELPKGVSASLANGKIEIKGPKGALSRPVPPNVDVAIEGNKITFSPKIGGRDGARFQGLARSLFAAMSKGAAEGYTKELELVGTGYRAELKGQTLSLSLGFSHTVLIELPKTVTCRVPAENKGTLIILEGSDKELMGQLSAKLKALRPPEPYGGKGVRFKGEKVRQKAGKSGGKGK